MDLRNSDIDTRDGIDECQALTDVIRTAAIYKENEYGIKPAISTSLGVLEKKLMHLKKQVEFEAKT